MKTMYGYALQQQIVTVMRIHNTTITVITPYYGDTIGIYYWVMQVEQRMRVLDIR